MGGARGAVALRGRTATAGRRGEGSKEQATQAAQADKALFRESSLRCLVENNLLRCRVHVWRHWLRRRHRRRPALGVSPCILTGVASRLPSAASDASPAATAASSAAAASGTSAGAASSAVTAVAAAASVATTFAAQGAAEPADAAATAAAATAAVSATTVAAWTRHDGAARVAQ